jgi:hypothetical protein
VDLMMLNDGGRTWTVPAAEQFQLETLERLPCGCVVAIQSVRPSDVTVVSIEAKGPHCTSRSHRANKVIRLGEGFDPFDYDETDAFSI